MNRSGRGRDAALIAGLALAAVLGAVGIFWRDLAVQYYVLGLERQPERLRAFLGETDGTLEKEAVLRFVGTSYGARAFSTMLLKEYFAALFHEGQPEEYTAWSSELGKDPLKIIRLISAHSDDPKHPQLNDALLFGLGTDQRSFCYFWDFGLNGEWKDGHGHGHGHLPPITGPLNAPPLLWELAERVRMDEVHWPELPGVSFKVVTVGTDSPVVSLPPAVIGLLDKDSPPRRFVALLRW